jgi:hypothetical protein
MAINSVSQGFTKTQLKNNAMINGYKGKEKAKPEKPDNTKKTDSPINIQTNEKPGLSQRAQEYLEKLKEKYGNINFVIVHDENYSKAGASDKAYNCFISVDLLEKMAADESVAKKYEAVIDDAIIQVDDLKEQAEAKGLSHLITTLGITISADGTVSFSAMLREGVRDLQGEIVNNKHKGIWAHTTEGILEALEKIREAAAAAKKDIENPDGILA